MTDTPDTRLVPAMIAEQAAATPAAVAVRAEDGTLTYGELLDRARRIAHALRAAGAGGEQVVGLACPRSVDGIAAMVGILTAGAAYCYLDPTWPADRLRHIIGECRIRLV